MNTKIDLKFPYTQHFKVGYLNTNKEPRRVITLVDFDNNKTSTSYARYLMSCHLKRYLLNTEHVDHIDNNKLNDSLNNLQILSQIENNRKNRKRTYRQLVCPVCNITFSKEARQVDFKMAQGKTPTCSRKCGGKFSHK